MSNMKHDALAKHGIKVIERVPIPPELIPEDASVEMEAKKAAGYFAAPDDVMDESELQTVKGRTLEE
jgi:hypothetical protein